MTLKDRKYISNYDIGKNQVISSGRLTTTDVNTSSFGSTGAYTGYNTAASSYNRSIIPLTINTLTGAASTLGSITSNFTTLAAANSANIASATTKGFIDSAGKWTAEGIKALGSAANGAVVGTKASTEGVATSLGSSATSAGLSTLGYITGAAGTAYGLYNMISGALNYKNRTTDAEMLQGSSTSTQSKFGHTYKLIGGFDENGILNLTNALNKADTTNMAMSGMSTGLSAGATIGSIFSPVGTAIGAILGGFGGLIGGSIWGDSEAEERARKVRQDITNTKEAIGGYNSQSESEAGSKGLRDMYNKSNGNVTTGILRADSGKNPGERGVLGYMSKDETMYDPTADTMNQVKYPGSPDQNVKDLRKDNVPLYGNIDPISILGHTIASGNKYYADLGRPFGKRAEQIREQFNSTNDSNEKLNLMLEMNQINKNVAAIALMLQEDSERKEMKHTLNYRRINADKGKVPKFGLGKWLSANGNSLSPLVGLAARLPYAISESRAASSEVPYALNSYVPNSTALSALNILGGLRYDPSSQLSEMNRVAAQNRYNINQTGNLSSGLKALLSTSANNQLFSQRGAILADAYNRNAQYKQNYANALMQYGQNEATRQQQALATQQEAYRQAVGAKQKWQEQARKNWYTLAGQTLQDYSTNYYQNKMLNLWDNQQKIDAYKAGMTGGSQVSQTPTSITTSNQPPYEIIVDNMGRKSYRLKKQ